MRIAMDSHLWKSLHFYGEMRDTQRENEKRRQDKKLIIILAL